MGETGSAATTAPESTSFAPTTGAGSTDTGEPPLPADTVRFAVIGDYGLDGGPTAKVAALVAGWDPEFVITAGDNNYFDGLASTIDVNIGKYYHQFIAPYKGKFGPGRGQEPLLPVPR